MEAPIVEIESAMDHAPRPHISCAKSRFPRCAHARLRRAHRACASTRRNWQEFPKIGSHQRRCCRMIRYRDCWDALKQMLNEYDWCFVLQTELHKRLQYPTTRENFHQLAKVKFWATGFFELCPPGTAHAKCTLGEHCQCKFYAELFKDFEDEELTTEEERSARHWDPASQAEVR